MTTTFSTRRRLLIGSAAAALLAATPLAALANRSDALLADILVGVGDAMQRDWIRRNYGLGRWDGRRWVYGGRRYTPREYRDFWLARYRPAPPPPPPHRRPPPPPPHRYGPPGPPPPPPPPPRHSGPPPGGPGRRGWGARTQTPSALTDLLPRDRAAGSARGSCVPAAVGGHKILGGFSIACKTLPTLCRLPSRRSSRP